MNRERQDTSRELRAVLGFWLKKNSKLDSVAPLGFESGSLASSTVSRVPGLSSLKKEDTPSWSSEEESRLRNVSASMMILQLDRDCQSTEMGRCTQPAGRGQG